MKSIIYWHPKIYHWIMRCLYKGNFEGRYRIIADQIPPQAEVLDVCCGDCYLYELLRDKDVSYFGLDFNESFVRAARRKGLKAERFDIRKDSLPRADYVVMMGSMYQFMPSQDWVIQKILGSAKKRAIISEPVVNLATSENMLLSKISKVLTDPGTGYTTERFSKEALLELFQKHNVTSIDEIEGGRDIVGVFDKQPSTRRASGCIRTRTA